MRPIRVPATAVAAVIASAIGTGAAATSASGARRPGAAPSAERTTDDPSPRDVGSLLAAARGAPPVLCALAARAIGTGDAWGGALGWTDDPPAPPLARALPLVQSGAGGGAPEADIGKEGDDGNPPNARGRLAPADAARLLEALGADDPCVRELAARLLGSSRDTALAAPLGVRLGAGAAPARAAAAFALGLAAPTAGVDALARALADTSPDVRANAAWALGRARGGRALSPLADRVRDADPHVRAAAVTAIGRLVSTDRMDTVRTAGVPGTTALLARVLREDADARVRRAAAWALARAGGDRAAEPGVATGFGSEVEHAARSPSANTAEEADTALAAALARDADPRVREMAAWALNARARRNAAARPAFVTALRTDTSAAVRETAAWALGTLRAGDPAATAALDAAAESDRNARVRGTAAWALGQTARRAAPAGLVRAVRDADPDVRLKAASALGQVRDPAAVPTLRDALARESEPGVRRALVRALVSAGAGSAQSLAPLLGSSDPAVREAAVRGLASREASESWSWSWPRPRPFP